MWGDGSISIFTKMMMVAGPNWMRIVLLRLIIGMAGAVVVVVIIVETDGIIVVVVAAVIIGIVRRGVAMPKAGIWGIGMVPVFDLKEII